MTANSADNLYVVFSRPPDSVSATDYGAWYEGHARENLMSGFTGVRRYTVETINVGTGVSPDRRSVDASVPLADYSYLALYTYNGELKTVRDDLARRVRDGDIALPSWFSQISFGSWSCRPAD